MKQYHIDELRLEDHHKLKLYLDERFGSNSVEGIYWIQMDSDMLDEVQASHLSCQPFYFALELGATSVSFEFLIRTRATIRCDCMRYANASQRQHIMHLADAIFEELGIRI